MYDQIAIDGPSGVGKSTIAKALARKLGLLYVDTGAMYRAVGVKALRLGIGVEDEARLSAMLEDTHMTFCYVEGTQHVLLDGVDVEEAIRTSEASRAASQVAKVPAVRVRMVALQRAMGQDKGVVMDGRDIGTKVFPHARHKFFLTATAQERAHRRHAELSQKGDAATYEEVLCDMIERDQRDSTRAASPLVQAEDAVQINTDGLSIEQVLDIVLKRVEAT